MYEILEFNEETLSKALSNNFTSSNQVRAKSHYLYFYEYLEDGLHAKTIVVEENYISKSYLKDYSNFYSSNFKNYERFCKRVHFFSETITEKRFRKLITLSELSDDTFWTSYLGYIVVKPLPNAKVGATVLKTYNSTNELSRFYPVIKPYQVNLFGKNLTVNSLAYQEQDSVVSANATTALWCVFHKTSQLFQTIFPSPSDITKSAKNSYNESGRIFPNQGLTTSQIGNAIESVGLVFELRHHEKIKDISWVKSFIYAYNRMGLPILLGLNINNKTLAEDEEVKDEIYQIQEEGQKKKNNVSAVDESEGHLVTVVGFRQSKAVSTKQSVKSQKDKISLLAEGIERFYAHDDQVGPFSRISFGSDTLITSWKLENQEKAAAEVINIIVPIHQDIKLTFEDIYSKVIILDFLLKNAIDNIITWDIYLELSNQYKEHILNNNYDVRVKEKILFQNLPKYIWVARGFFDGKLAIDLIFDATDIPDSDFCLQITSMNAKIRTSMIELLDRINFSEFIKIKLSPHYLTLILEDCGLLS